MATIKAIPLPPRASLLDADRHDLLGLTLSAALPLAVFVIMNGIGQLTGNPPLFFSPFGLPGWVGAVMHLAALPLFGVARGMVEERGEAGRRAGWWLVGLMAGMILFPFAVVVLDSLALSVVSMALFLLGLATVLRVTAVSSQAGMVMSPGLLWMGLSAAMGLALVAAWAPPFAVTNANNTI